MGIKPDVNTARRVKPLGQLRFSRHRPRSGPWLSRTRAPGTGVGIMGFRDLGLHGVIGFREEV